MFPNIRTLYGILRNNWNPPPIITNPPDSMDPPGPPLPCYIRKLPNELLWIVFEMNHEPVWTERFDGDINLRPLTILRRSSQVCRTWRKHILDTSSLWSKIIELDVLAEGNEEWRKLVLERCGKLAPLCIHGHIFENETEAIDRFLVNLLHNNWHRIQDLELTVGPTSATFSKEIWDVFWWPAPLLQIFHVYTSQADPSLSFLVEHPIFSNHAPRLKEFSYTDPSPSYLSPDAPWFSQLRILEFWVTSDAMELFNALGTMHNLNQLVIGSSLYLLEPEVDSESEDEPVTVATVSLPQLQKLHILNTIDVTHFFLKHIIPAPGAFLFFSNDEAEYVAPLKEISDLFTEISRYARSFFDRPTGTCKLLTLNLWTDRLLFRVDDNHVVHNDDQRPTALNEQFAIDIRFLSDNLPRDVIPFFFPFIDLRKYTPIAQFEFILPDLVISQGLEPVLNSFLLSFRFVTVITTCHNGLRSLVKADRLLPELFPSLQTLQLKFMESTHPSFLETIQTYLRGRSGTGRPLHCLDISHAMGLKESLDWGFLREFIGLNVILGWGTDGEPEHEYRVCR